MNRDQRSGEWAPFQVLAWNQLHEYGAGPDWMTCPLWLLAICPFWCDGQPPECDGTRDR